MRRRISVDSLDDAKGDRRLLLPLGFVVVAGHDPARAHDGRPGDDIPNHKIKVVVAVNEYKIQRSRLKIMNGIKRS